MRIVPEKYRKTTVARLLMALVAVVAAFEIPVSARENELEIVESSADSTLSVSVGSLFVSSPLSVLDLLRPEMRQSLVTHRADGSKAAVVNNLYSMSTMEVLTDNYLKVRLTDASTLTLNLIEEKGKSPVIVAVYTIGGPERASDSDISFYDTDWKTLKKEKMWYQPKISDFLSKEADPTSDLKKVGKLVPFPTYELTVSEDGRTVTGNLTVGKYMSEEAETELRPYVVGKRVWRWDGKKYNLEKTN